MGVPAWLAGVGHELRSAIGDEFRAEAAADERAVAGFRLRHRTLSDVATELMHRGDAVTVFIGNSTVRGRLAHVASNLATLTPTTGARLHLNLDSPITLRRNPSEKRHAGRGRDSMACDSFPAQLRSFEMAGRLIRLEADSPAGRVLGRLEAVAVDHVVLTTPDTKWYVPLGVIHGVWE